MSIQPSQAREQSSLKLNTRPDVLDFRDPREFLNKCTRTLSLRALARRAGYTHASTLSMVLSGRRRLTPAVAARLAQALSLKGRRKKYFLNLARMDSARSERARIEIRDQLMQL